MNPLRLASLILLFCLAFSPAHAAQKAIGTSCNSDNSTVDFDTLAQCNGSTIIKAPLMLGAVASPPYATTACDAAKAGMLQYTGGVVQYCNGSAWSTMGSSSGTGGQSMVSGWPDAIVCNTSPVGRAVLFPQSQPNSDGSGRFRYMTAADQVVDFEANGNYATTSGWTSNFDCVTSTLSISQLVARGQAFNFVNGGANGAAAMADGTAGAPGLYFSADTNTGLYRPTTDTLAIATGGTERLRVTATGSVGIGTTTPATALQVNGTITASAISTSSFLAPTVQKFTSGSGTYTTPTSPRGPLYLRVRMVGGGGGGSGSGAVGSSSNGGNGGNSTFGSGLLVAGGGIGGYLNGMYSNGGTGGTSSLGTGPIGLALTGATGGAPAETNISLFAGGGMGGSSAFGGAGSNGGSTNGFHGTDSGVANTGGGGGGAASLNTNVFAGQGGGSGGFVDAIISSPAASYAYSVGVGGAAGAAGISGYTGGAGGSGIIIVEEYYQ